MTQREFANKIMKAPRVRELFCLFALEAKARGYRKYSARAILNRIRWHLDPMAHGSQKGIRIGNELSPWLARLAMTEHPELEGLFTVKKMKNNLEFSWTNPVFGVLQR